MKTAVLFAAAALGVSAVALATPQPDSVKFNTRLFNDNPSSVLTTTSSYPTSVTITDTTLQEGNANRHNWLFSTDGGATNALFANSDSFDFFTDITITGDGNGEAGINIMPWWDNAYGGVFNLRTNDGEVAVFSGRLPFYSFTANHGVNYVKGTTVRIGVEYFSANLDAEQPGRIRYHYGAFSSPWINFDQANPAEAIPHGLWGILNGARVGGHVQAQGGFPGQNGLSVTWGNIYFVPAPGAAGLLGVAGLVAMRRRR
jgi:hypothetical protein